MVNLKKVEIFKLPDEYRLLCKKVNSFPDGVGQAFDEMYKQLPSPDKRNYFGISWMDEHGQVIYQVAAEKRQEDAFTNAEFEESVLPRADYLMVRIMNWYDHLSDIKEVFGRLIADPRTDKSFPCVEWYRSDDELLCMMKIAGRD